MAYIGNTPAENYASFLTETFTVSATTNYTLSHAVTNENEIRLVINGVVQQPGSGKAYTASGTTLTLSSATASGDVMYAVYLGRALQTVNPPNASVGISQLADSAKSIPAFRVGLSSAQTISNSTHTIIIFNSEQFDTDSAYDTSTGRFTVPSGKAGKYYFNAMFRFQSTNVTGLNIKLQKNGTDVVNMQHHDTGQYPSINASLFIDLAVDDYITVTAFQGVGANRDLTGNEAYTNFSGFKLIG